MNTLRNFYYLRAVVAFVWCGLAFAAANGPAFAGVALFILYPAWDALANWLDAKRSGGLQANPGQRFNMVVSIVTAGAMAVALANRGSAGGVLVFGVWALLAGLLQLAVGIRRRKLGGQAFMMLSGAQSGAAGIHFIVRSFAASTGIAQAAPYAALGGIYFLLSALWLTFRRRRVVA